MYSVHWLQHLILKFLSKERKMIDSNNNGTKQHQPNKYSKINLEIYSNTPTHTHTHFYYMYIDEYFWFSFGDKCVNVENW